MTKIDIIQNVYEKLGFSKKDSADIVESVSNWTRNLHYSAESIDIQIVSGFAKDTELIKAFLRIHRY